VARVVLFGAGRGADVAYRYLTKDSEHEICAFAVDKAYRKTDELRGLPVVDFEDVERRYPPAEFKMLVMLGFQGMNRLRHDKYLQAKAKGYELISYVSSKIHALEPPNVGENCFILENNSINLDVKIGNNVTIWSSNHIGDCTVIGDHVWISSMGAISGFVTIQPFAFLGVGAVISNNVTIAPKSFIGANVLVTQSTEEGGVYVAGGAKKIPMPSEQFLQMVKIS
jgi:sugar O-acyltransferase (sialic acid O-acetyltransferase NeuD family)